jgi:predicted unusual protein kinase regulating ubiquinone biosynthesis (AarF/ABC1/UbiB family)
MPDLNSKTSVSVSSKRKGEKSNGRRDESAVISRQSPAAGGDVGEALTEPAFLSQLDHTQLSHFNAVEGWPQEVDVRPRRRSLRLQLRYFHTLWFATRLFARLLFWYWLMPRIIGEEAVNQGNTERWIKYAREFRGFAILMGGMMIKLGQFVSARVDVLPEEITNELSGLQDEVPPVPNDRIRQVIECELGSIEMRYKSFADQPVAAASLGQVYRAQLLNGEKVVVKVQRPGIRDIVYTDLAALRVVAHVAKLFKFIRRRADTVALTEEFGRVLLEELSYLHEARNAAHFAEIFKHDMGIYIPAVYPEHSTDSVLTIEDVTTIKITDYAAMEAAGISRKAVATRLMDCYLKQVFEDRFFHADPHPGNLFVYPLPHENPAAQYGKDGRPFYLIFVDFGMTGTLTPELTSALINTLVCIVTRDADGLVKSYADLGFLMPDADTERIVEATKATFDQVWGLSFSDMKNVSFTQARELGQEFNDLLYAMPFQVPQDFIYLGRAMGILSGMATSIDPSFNPWQELFPYTQKLMKQTFREGAAIGEFTDVLGMPILQSLFNGNAPKMLVELARAFFNRAVTMPQQLDRVLTQLDKGDLTVRVMPAPAYRKQLQRIEAQSRRTTRATIFAALLVSSTLLYTSGSLIASMIGFASSGVVLLSVLWAGD